MNVAGSFDYISVGGNRSSAAADWDTRSGLFAFGASQNVALWLPEEHRLAGVSVLLPGHEGRVSAIRFCNLKEHASTVFLSGSADSTIRIWQGQALSPNTFRTHAVIKGHSGAINCLACATDCPIVASGAVDQTIRLWRLDCSEEVIVATLLQIIQTEPRFLPLALALHPLPDSDGILLAAGGSFRSMEIFVCPSIMTSNVLFEKKVTLSGHENWVRSLDFIQVDQDESTSLLLASASQDKYIRVWSIRKAPPEALANSVTANGIESSLQLVTNKIHKLHVASHQWLISLESLLLGHEDWVVSVRWRLHGNRPKLLSVSADNSVSIWESDPVSGLWLSQARLGDLSVQKGSTTATGSFGGLYCGLWSPMGDSIVALGRTGSWRRWSFIIETDSWIPSPALTGHTRAVRDIAWAPDGSFLISVSADQTTRLHAEARSDNSQAWRELGRPQIHGYDLNCAAILGRGRFVSGADEKLLRVFAEPQSTSAVLQKLCAIAPPHSTSQPVAATIPTLGLSNKADVEPSTQSMSSQVRTETVDLCTATHSEASGGPPLEDTLARHTLWPEIEKLYGHGYEISAVAASPEGDLIASACKASAIEHAVIRLYETQTWRELQQPLMAHSLTIHRLRFDDSGKFLLSVGRDRQWSAFRRDAASGSQFTQQAVMPRAHTRAITDATWICSTTRLVFVTVSRDKCCKIWSLVGTSAELLRSYQSDSPIVSTDFLTRPSNPYPWLALAGESGGITIYDLDIQNFDVRRQLTNESNTASVPMSRIVWRPDHLARGACDESAQIALAGDDGALRIMSIATSSGRWQPYQRRENKLS